MSRHRPFLATYAAGKSGDAFDDACQIWRPETNGIACDVYSDLLLGANIGTYRETATGTPRDFNSAMPLESTQRILGGGVGTNPDMGPNTQTARTVLVAR